MLTFFNPYEISLTPQERARETEAFRYIANCLHLFGLCRHKRCFRERACKHNPRECVARYAPLAPEGAREFMRAMLEGRDRGLDFDAMKEGHEDEMEEFAFWRALIENTRTPGTVVLRYLLEPDSDPDCTQAET
jgi:hypothetical protein